MDLQQLFPAGLTGIIYDCDGVMIDSAVGNRHLYNTILAELGLPPLTASQEAFAFQATFAQAMQFLVPKELQDRMEDAIKTVNYDRDVLARIELMPGYRQFVEKARNAGLRQAVDTNRTDFGIEKILTRFDLEGFLDPVISSSNTAPKPSPEGVNRIGADWGCQPGQMLFVGDNPDDRAAAKGGGAVFAAFGAGDLEGDIKVRDWKELAEFIWPGKTA